MTSNIDRLKSYYHTADLPRDCSRTEVYVSEVAKGNEIYLSGSTSRGCKIERIVYHCPKGEGDSHYADIEFTFRSGSQVKSRWLRVFSPDSVTFFTEPLEVVN